MNVSETYAKGMHRKVHKMFQFQTKRDYCHLTQQKAEKLKVCDRKQRVIPTKRHIYSKKPAYTYGVLCSHYLRYQQQ